MNYRRRHQINLCITDICRTLGYLADIQAAEQEAVENTPENLQGTNDFAASEEAIESLEIAIESMEVALLELKSIVLE